MQIIKDLSTQVKIVGTASFVVLLLLASIGLAAASFTSMAATASREVQAHTMAIAVADAYEQYTTEDDQGNMFAALIAERNAHQHSFAEATYAQVVQARDAVAPDLARAAHLASSRSERALLARIVRVLADYNAVIAQMRRAALRGDVARTLERMIHGTNAPAVDLTAAFPALQTLIGADIKRLNASIDASRDSGDRLLLILGVVGVLAILPCLLTARAVARPLRRLTAAAARLAHGDVNVEALLPPASRDEIGVLSSSFRAMVAYQSHMASAVQAVATGDLTVSIVPQGDADRLGQAVASMLANLRTLIGRVTETARQVGSGSSQLAEASSQIGQASSQIARSIEEVARGASEQSRHAAEIMTGMMSLTAGHDSSHPGALAQTDQAVGELRSALEQTTHSVSAVTTAAAQATTTAQQGGAAVSQTIQSIGAVRAAVLQSAEQVQALGRSSQEITAIVEAIDDIAEQTNLLALNAAIEAARAGEHGKGFTVVAAEVRKLAERASSETKEITARISAIQRQVAEVVAAMESGSARVEESAVLGEQARVALAEILGVVEETQSQSQAIGGAVTRMTQSVAAVSGAAAQVAQVTEEIAGAIESITAVSEQSAAGAEEVSASTEEQSAATEEMAASAQELAAQAASLREVVGQFRVEEAAPAGGGGAAPDQRPFSEGTNLHERAA